MSGTDAPEPDSWLPIMLGLVAVIPEIIAILTVLLGVLMLF